MNAILQLNLNDDLSVVLCGEAGQGIVTISQALTHIIKADGFYVFAVEEYMSRIRGGSNSTEIRVANHKVAAFVNRIDILIPLSKGAIAHLQDRISKDTLIVGKQEDAPNHANIVDIDFVKLATAFNNKIYSSSIAIGFVLGLLHVKTKAYEVYFSEHFADKPTEVVQKNILAAQEGYKLGEGLITAGKIKHNIQPALATDKKVLSALSAAKAMALGAIAGGCNFISAYPMSPGTGVLSELAKYSDHFDIIVEQAEDEIAAINMALGAWYTGARGMVTTAGGGFALMCEGLSLAGIVESSLVINVGQRPGPATGLPTRTEQADLNLVLYAGHGEFPRIILAPGTIEQTFYLTQKAFELADKYQVPVLILTDQYLMDSYYNIAPIDPLLYANDTRYIVAAEKEYQRYKLTDNGVSPRGIPGWGEGIVCVDSDEHTEAGYITEDFSVRNKMVQKRLKKMEQIKKDIIAPEFCGRNDYKILVIAWGSNYHVVKEALDIVSNDEIAFLHFTQLFPLEPSIADYFTKAHKVLVIENNATGQFANLLQQQLQVKIDNRLLKYNGLPFGVEEVVAALSGLDHKANN